MFRMHLLFAHAISCGSISTMRSDSSELPICHMQCESGEYSLEIVKHFYLMFPRLKDWAPRYWYKTYETTGKFGLQKSNIDNTILIHTLIHSQCHVAKYNSSCNCSQISPKKKRHTCKEHPPYASKLSRVHGDLPATLHVPNCVTWKRGNAVATRMSTEILSLSIMHAKTRFTTH